MTNDYTGNRGGSGCGSTALNFLLLALGGFLVLVLLTLFGFWWAGDRFITGMNTIFNAPTPAPQIDVRSVVLRQVRGASELTTTEYVTEAIIPARQEGTILYLFPTETRLLYIAVGSVKAGVDLSEIQDSDVEVFSDTLRITLPPPRLLDAKIDVEQSQVYDFNRGFLNLGPEARDLQTQAEREGLRQIILKACEYGILEQANQEAEAVVGRLLSLGGFTQVIVETQPPAPNECPSG